MEITKLIVLLWFILPILVYLTGRLHQKFMIRKYPRTITARIVTVTRRSFHNTYEGDHQWQWTYTYTIDGIEYSGKSKISGVRDHEIDEEILIRYNPQKPHRSSTYQPLSKQDWRIVGAIWFTFSLGFACCFIALGLMSTPIIPSLLRRETWSKLKPIQIAGIFGFLLIELLLLGIGIFILLEIGFVRQNLLWLLWTF